MMDKETKKHLIIGAAIIVAAGIGVVIWKRYQVAQASAGAAADQANQDTLELEAAALASNAYAGQQGGAQPFSVASPGATVPQSLADEILSLERALGIAPPATATPPATPAAPAAPAAPAPKSTGTGAAPAPQPIFHGPFSDTPQHNRFGVLNFLGEEVLV